MSLVLGFAIYFICWWLVLLTVLPLRVTTQSEEGQIVPGTPESAPVKPQILLKLCLTTLITTIVFAVIYVVMVYELIGLDDIPFLPTFN